MCSCSSTNAVQTDIRVHIKPYTSSDGSDSSEESDVEWELVTGSTTRALTLVEMEEAQLQQRESPFSQLSHYTGSVCVQLESNERYQLYISCEDVINYIQYPVMMQKILQECLK